MIYRFGEFHLDARKRVLLRHGKPVTLNSKAFDLLLVLVTSGGCELSKDELMQLVWQEQIVEENNLAVHIYNLRKILGERKDEHRYIITIPGVGYRFVADVKETTSEVEELFIESGAVSGIVVEEEERRNPTFRENVIAPPSLTPFSKSETVKGALMDSTNETVTATTTAMAPLVQSRNRRAVWFTVVLVGLSLPAGVGGYWLYRNRSQTSVSPSSIAHQQMTLTRITEGRILGAPTISPDGKFIAYVENTFAGAGTLFVQQIETNTVRQLLEPAERTFGCTEFSPDGSLIYYVVFDKRDPYAALYSVPMLGGAPKRIMGNFSACFSVSPDGNRVAFYRADPENNRTNLMIATLDSGGQQTLLARSGDEMRFGFTMAWLPDGNLIAFNAIPEPNKPNASLTIFGVDVKNGEVKPLTSEKFSGMGKMSWLSDGRSLVFVAKRARVENKLYLMDYPSGAVRRITNDLESYGNYGLGITADSITLVADIYERKSEIWRVDAKGDASKAIRVTSGTTDGRAGITAFPDGRITYVVHLNKSLEIRTAKEDGTDAKDLTTDSFTQKDVAASPDGRYLVYASDQTGESHIFRMNADDGSEVTQLTFGPSSDSQPDVSPDGNWVIYTSWNGKHSAIWKVPMAGGAAIQLTDYESGSPVFAPDGKFIAGVLPSNSRAKLGSIFIIPAEGGQPIKLFQALPFGFGFPTIHWTPDGKAIVFNKGENGVFNLLQQPLSGGAPQQLTDFPSGFIWNFAYSRDGKRIFLSRGTTSVDVVLIKNFR